MTETSITGDELTTISSKLEEHLIFRCHEQVGHLEGRQQSTIREVLLTPMTIFIFHPLLPHTATAVTAEI